MCLRGPQSRSGRFGEEKKIPTSAMIRTPWPHSTCPNRYVWSIAARNISSITTIKIKVKEILPPTHLAGYKNITVTNAAFS